MGSLYWHGLDGLVSGASTLVGSHHEHGVLLQEEGDKGSQPYQVVGARGCSGNKNYTSLSYILLDILYRLGKQFLKSRMALLQESKYTEDMTTMLYLHIKTYVYIS